MYAGIDYDTNAVHIVLLPELGDPEYLPFVMHGNDAFERARVVRDVMPSRGWWDDQGVIAIGIEEQNSGNPKMRASVQKLKMVQGAILSCLPKDTLVCPMSGSEWRVKVGLAGNAKKPEVAGFVYARQPGAARREWPQDACDAYCLALAVQKLTEPMP